MKKREAGGRAPILMFTLQGQASLLKSMYRVTKAAQQGMVNSDRKGPLLDETLTI